MSDNVVSNPGTGGATFATQEVGGVHHSRVKLETDVSGSPADVSSTNPVPVRLNDGSANLDIATLDLDSGGGTVNRVAVGIALPGAGGPVAGGTSSFPIRIDPTNATPMQVTGPTGHGFTVSTSPVMMSGRANGSGDPTPVTDGDVCYVWVDLVGRTIISPHMPPQVAAANTWGPLTGLLTTAGNATIITAPGTESIHITSIQAINSDGANDTILTFYDNGVARVQYYLLKLAANELRMTFDVPWKLTAATAFVANLSANANVYLNIHYYIAA